ncbi:MAG: hypothetical protein ILA55_01980 [Erysipelotrichaceae bacterium]|nr:hypothetical protein [Erysipelotrichaceae bacterium]
MSELLEKILDKDNIDLAMKQVKVNKGSPGVDGMKVDEVEDYLREHGEELYGRIRKRKYKPLPVRRVLIPKPDGSKRPLGIPSVKDRVLQQAITQVISPMCEKVFSDSSYGFRENRSCEKAVLKALEYFNDGYDWLVDLDAYGIIGLNSKDSADKGFLKLSPILFSPQKRLMVDLRRKHAQNEDLSAKRSAACNFGSTVSDAVPSRLLQRQSAEHTPDVDLHRSTVRYSKDVSLACAA